MSLVNVVDNRIFEQHLTVADLKPGDFYSYRNEPQAAVYVYLGEGKEFRFNDTSTCRCTMPISTKIFLLKATITVSNT